MTNGKLGRAAHRGWLRGRRWNAPGEAPLKGPAPQERRGCAARVGHEEPAAPTWRLHTDMSFFPGKARLNHIPIKKKKNFNEDLGSGFPKRARPGTRLPPPLSCDCFKILPKSRTAVLFTPSALSPSMQADFRSILISLTFLVSCFPSSSLPKTYLIAIKSIICISECSATVCYLQLGSRGLSAQLESSSECYIKAAIRGPFHTSQHIGSPALAAGLQLFRLAPGGFQLP